MGDGARISHEPGSLIGRDDDLEYLAAFADRAAVSGGALLLSGEAGVGKTVVTGGLRDVPRLLDDARKADAGRTGSLVAPDRRHPPAPGVPQAGYHLPCRPP